MPVAQYKIKVYIKDILEEMEIPTNSEEIYYNLVRYSIGYNPRSIKRLFNTYMLLKIMLENLEQKTDEYYNRVLFAILCMQIAFEDVYNYLSMTPDEELVFTFLKQISDYEFFEKIYNRTNNDDTYVNSCLWLKQLKLLKDEEKAYEICSFMKIFCEAVSTKENDITLDDIQKMFEVFNITSITSIADITSEKNTSSRATRYEYQHEDQSKYYSIDDNIEKKNAPNGWNKAIIEGYKLFGEEVSVDSFSQAMRSVLEKLYERNPEKFKEVKDNPQRYGLTTLFLGVGKGGEIVSKGQVKLGNEYIMIEQKTNYNKKVSDLRKIMQVLGLDKSELQFKVKLAKGNSRKNKI